MSRGIALWPPQASAHAVDVDLLIGSFGAMVWALTLPVFILCALFAIRYRRSRVVNRTHDQDSNVWLETSWSIIPFLLTIGFYVWATKLFLDLQHPPPDPLDINVVAKQWMWKFQHMSGAREIDALHVPARTPVRLLMTSEDAIHSLYVPALRIKQDLVPGRVTSLWFRAEKPGIYPIRCAEYCGTDHSVMSGRLIVLSRDGYAAWLASARDGGTLVTLAEQGRRLFDNLGCGACHAASAAVRAPSLAELAGRPVTLADGRAIRADDAYLRDALLLPNKDVVAGYPPIMPTYQKLLTPEQLNALLAYLKTGKAGL